jgi:hypothetical protein
MTSIGINTSGTRRDYIKKEEGEDINKSFLSYYKYKTHTHITV